MDKITIKVITWNMGDSITKINDWNKELEKWSIIQSNEDIIFITLQETTDNIGRFTFFQALNKKLKDYTIYHDGEGSYVPTLTFHVFGYVCIKDGVKVNRIPYVGSSHPSVSSTCIYKYYVCTKPTKGFGLIINNKKIIFIGSHFPVNTSDKITFGLQERIDTIKTIKQEVIEPIANSLNGVDTIIWAGDMNFRIQNDGVDQLDNLIENNYILKNYIEPIKNFNPTCRYTEYNDIDDYSDFVKNRKYDDKRIPSYCDRIIYKGNFTITNYYSYPHLDQYYPKSIAYSDHEAVVLEGFINLNIIDNMNGGYYNYYKNKYFKYKKKYILLKNEI